MDPDPLQPIADRLVPLVIGRLEWWREGVRRWATDPPRHSVQLGNGWWLIGHNPDHFSLKEWVDGGGNRSDGESLILPVPFPAAVLTEDERIALLAAIHDFYAGGIEQINPWLNIPSDKADRSMSFAYGLLLSDRVPELREHWDTCRATVELYLGKVEQQLTASGKADHSDAHSADGSAKRLGVQTGTEYPQGLFPINITRVRESLVSLADDIEFIATGETDDNRDHDAWERRKNAGVQLVRLRATLNNGELDRADCDRATMNVLRCIWYALKRLNYGSHHDPPNQYCGPLYLPGEIRPLAEGFGVRPSYERYDPHPDRLRAMTTEGERQRAIRELKRNSDFESPRTIELAIRAIRRAGKPHLTTKRQLWCQLPQELRKLSSSLEQAMGAVTTLPGASDGNQLSIPPGSDPPAPTDQDGPCHPYTWRHKGQKLPDNSLQRATWNLVNHLWNDPERTATFDELAEPVFGDHSAEPDGYQIGKQRTLANKFFSGQGISWKVASSPKDRHVWLTSPSSQPGADQKGLL